MGSERHLLPPENHEGSQLSPSIIKTLCETGVPAEVRLDGWVGPTFFTSEIGDGRIKPLTEFSRTRPDASSWFVLGTIREPEGKASPYAAFSVKAGSQDIVLTDLDSEAPDRFVNSSLTAFLESLAIFVGEWSGVSKCDEQKAERLAEKLRKDLAACDPRALEQPESFWSSWLGESV